MRFRAKKREYLQKRRGRESIAIFREKLERPLRDIATRLDPDPVDLLFSRIETVSRNARTQWIVLLTFSAYAFVVFLSTDDADFFLGDRSTYLPLLAVQIPTSIFFVVASLAVCLLYASVHIKLQRLWSILAHADLCPRRKPLGEQIYPWTVNDFVLLLRKDEAVLGRPMRLLLVFAAVGLTWMLAPLLVALYWWRSMTGHAEWTTLVIGLSAWLSFVVAITSGLHLRRTLRGIERQRKRYLRVAFAIALLVAMIWLSIARTEGGFTIQLPKWMGIPANSIGFDLRVHQRPSKDDIQFEINRIVFDQQGPLKQVIAETFPSIATLLSLAPINLRATDFIPKPADWQDPAVAEPDFLALYCKKNNFSEERCAFINRFGGAITEKEREGQERWCEANARGSDCIDRMSWTSSWYRAAWSDERARYRSRFPRISLRDADLRGANLVGAFLPNVDLRGARLGRANLAGAVLEGADLTDTSMLGAILWGTSMQWADAWGSDFRHANIYSSSFVRAALRGAFFSHAVVWGVDYSFADVSGSDFRETELKAVNFSGASLWGALFANAKVVGAIVHGSDMSYMVGLTQPQLDQMIGDETTKITRNASGDVSSYLRIPECWVNELPKEFYRRPSTAPGFWVHTGYIFPEHWICADGDRRWHVASGKYAERFADRLIPNIGIKMYNIE